MSLPASPSQQIFDQICDECAEEFPALSLHFIPFEPGAVETAFEQNKIIFEDHPAFHLWDEEKTRLVRTQTHGTFALLLEDRSEHFLPQLLKKRRALGLCFIDTAQLSLFENTELSERFCAYVCVFKIFDQFLKQPQKSFLPLPVSAETTITTADALQETLARQRLQLMGEAFAAMLIEYKGSKGALQKILKKLCYNAVHATSKIRPEDHPLPMAVDGLNVVYKDLKDDRAPKTGLIKHMHFMASEIGETYDDMILKNWSRFAQSAQDMAWSGYNATEILSAAIYVSESPYVRSNAHICAEYLNTNPVPLKDPNLYNPFHDQESNERTHFRLCRTAYIDIIEQINEGSDPQIFLKAAKAQTEKLLNGYPLGWCAPALIETENTYRLFTEGKFKEEAEITDSFHSVCAQVKWSDLQRLARRIVSAKRAGKEVNANDVLNMLEKDARYSAYKSAFEILQ